MIIPITAETHGQIRNPVFAEYAAMIGIYEYMEQFSGRSGSIRRTTRTRPSGDARRRRARTFATRAFTSTHSPACVACKKGVGIATFFISLRCHRDCYYCFNPNQMDYEFHTSHTRDLVQELDEIAAQGQQVNCLELTGGEPLLY